MELGGGTQGSNQTGDLWAEYRPYSIIQHAYSRYIGVEISVPTSGSTYPTDIFRYKTKLSGTISGLANWASVVEDGVSGKIADIKYVNIGHLVNVYRTAGGRWGQSNIKDIYKINTK